MTKILMASNPEKLAEELAKYKRTATVEAEYGTAVVEGSELTLAHHGTRSENPAPCLFEDGPVEVDAIGISHMDLDALGGIASILGHACAIDQKACPEFWAAAAFLDTNGIHRALDCPEWESEHQYILAFLAWHDENRLFPLRDGSVADVSAEISTGLDAIASILQGDPEMIKAGMEWENRRGEEEAACFMSEHGSIRIFVGEAFCNMYYRRPDDTVAEAIISFNRIMGSITLSFEDNGERLNACQIVQSLWGEGAGGHAGIAGSPRDKRMTFKDLKEIVRSVETNLKLMNFPGIES